MRLKLRATRRVMVHKTAMTITEEREYTLCPIPIIDAKTCLAAKDTAQAYFAWVGKRPKSEAHIKGVKAFLQSCAKDSYEIEWFYQWNE